MTERQDADIAEYRAVSTAAIVGLIVGLLGPLALSHPLLWTLPAVGAAICLTALVRIAQQTPTLLGRKAALIGLALSILFAAAGPTHWLVYRRLVRQEASQFGLKWFSLLAERQPHKAHQLTSRAEYRQPFDDTLWEYYGQDSTMRLELTEYVNQPLVRTLLALGPKAEVRYYGIDSQRRANNADEVEAIYAVTYEDDGKKTFFVLLKMHRFVNRRGQAAWRVAVGKGGYRPAGFP